MAKAPPTRPLTLEACWEHIVLIEEAYHRQSNECAVILGKQELAFINKCKTCIKDTK